MQELYKLHEDTVNNLHNMYQEGAITEAQFNEYKQNVDNELQENLANFSGEEQMEVSPNYEDEISQLVESEVLKTQFGAAILELGAEVGYESVDELSEDLSEALDNDIDQTNAVLTGDALPDEDFVMAIIELFELDEDDAEDIIESAQEAWQDYEFLMETEEADLEEMPEEGNYSRQLQYQANFGGQTQSNQKVEELENKISEFESRDALKDLLNDRVQKVENLVRDFHMPPVVAEAIIGNFNTSSNDRIAAFSETAQKNNVSLEAEIHATDKVIDVFEKLQLGETALFQQHADDEVAEFEASEDQQVDQLAQGSLSAFRKQNADRLQ